ncbi:winged helix-turn-helix domain-containing protein [Psychrobacillus sp. NPDC096426]|uniref:winged helix-turn-helix domain-containing protein n=1 Tax=Psychrobacillus sp. NPDC096426 TaxID=3364491 RepID=UPI0038129ADF
MNYKKLFHFVEVKRMEKIKFSNTGYKVTYRSEKIFFLPREYQLFKFLYQNPSRIFSREDLLDAVWPMEDPVDRTVDDHIYRVRKKIEPLSSMVKIETIRGQGYLLSTKEVHESPLLKDNEVSTQVKSLFHKYHLYGQGDALKLLEENQNAFGFQIDLPNLLYLHFMKGNFSWFLEEPEISFWEKCFYLLHIYSFIESDKMQCLDYFTCALSAEEIPEYYRLEMKLLNRLYLLIFTKQLDEATTLLHQSKKEIEEKNIKGFVPLILLSELYIALLQKNFQKIEERMEETKKALVNYPYLRENADFSIIKGIYSLLKKNESKAEDYIDEGFQLLQEAKFIPGMIININMILFYLEEFGMNGRLQTYYQELKKKYIQEYKLNELHSKIEIQLKYHLK